MPILFIIKVIDILPCSWSDGYYDYNGKYNLITPVATFTLQNIYDLKLSEIINNLLDYINEE